MHTEFYYINLKGKGHFEYLRVTERIILNCILNQILRESVYWIDSAQYRGSCEHTSSSIRREELLN
jgi:hypothetical protein